MVGGGTGDVPMHKVKFNVNTEYAYLNNFKVLQSEFFPPVSIRAKITPQYPFIIVARELIESYRPPW